ncbi:hypothetical protein HO173_008196 [Letharia columbiana]|uniref:Uncharacterized protein n=1 Tax=Letharia columbiana TaxID=112416 RepID=A0A8H6L321_9LECA|nr:uncharacterized protein HO173_008196 [Letharia columbiana]KAF6233639.1 hypothetical protein HO173_008196 [Letharia columbiana]
MSSPVSIMTLASDLLVLGAGVSIAGFVLKGLLAQYKRYIPAPIQATFMAPKAVLKEMMTWSEASDIRGEVALAAVIQVPHYG